MDQAEARNLENQLRDVQFVQVEDYDSALLQLKKRREAYFKSNDENISLERIDTEVFL